jgi:hypothetical protein
MAKRKYWWPSSLPEQYLKVKTIKDGIAANADALALTNPQVTAMQGRCDAFIGAYEFQVAGEQVNQSVTAWRDQVFYGTPKGDAVSPAPVYPVKGAVTYTRGTVDQIFDDRDYILSLPGYTEAIGENIGYIGEETDGPDLGSFQPTIKAEPAQQGGFEFAVIIGNRGDSDQWVLSAAPVGSATWQQIGTFTGKSATATWPGTGDAPVQIQLRVQLLRKNANYGQPSDIILITVIP